MMHDEGGDAFHVRATARCPVARRQGSAHVGSVRRENAQYCAPTSIDAQMAAPRPSLKTDDCVHVLLKSVVAVAERSSRKRKKMETAKDVDIVQMCAALAISAVKRTRRGGIFVGVEKESKTLLSLCSALVEPLGEPRD